MYNIYKKVSEDGLNRIIGWIVQTPEWNKKVQKVMGGNYELHKEGFATREAAEEEGKFWFENLPLYTLYKIGNYHQEVLDNGLIVLLPSQYNRFSLGDLLKHEAIKEGFRTKEEAQAFGITWFKDFEEKKIPLCPTCGSCHVTKGKTLYMADGTESWNYDCKHAHGFAVPKEKVKI